MTAKKYKRENGKFTAPGTREVETRIGTRDESKEPTKGERPRIDLIRSDPQCPMVDLSNPTAKFLWDHLEKLSKEDPKKYQEFVSTHLKAGPGTKNVPKPCFCIKF